MGAFPGAGQGTNATKEQQRRGKAAAKSPPSPEGKPELQLALPPSPPYCGEESLSPALGQQRERSTLTPARVEEPGADGEGVPGIQVPPADRGCSCVPVHPSSGAIPAPALCSGHPGARQRGQRWLLRSWRGLASSIPSPGTPVVLKGADPRQGHPLVSPLGLGQVAAVLGGGITPGEGPASAGAGSVSSPLPSGKQNSWPAFTPGVIPALSVGLPRSQR